MNQQEQIDLAKKELGRYSDEDGVAIITQQVEDQNEADEVLDAFGVAGMERRWVVSNEHITHRTVPNEEGEYLTTHALHIVLNIRTD